MDEEREISLTRLAEVLQLSARQVTRLVKEGELVKTGRNKYPQDENTGLYILYLRRGGGDYSTERTRLIKAQADGQEMKNAEREGELLHRDEVVRGCQQMHGAVKSRVLAIPSTVKTRLPETADEQVHAIDELIREALTELAADGIPGGLKTRMAGTGNGDIPPTPETDPK